MGIGLAEIGIIIYLILWIIALVDIMRSKFKKNLYELMWLIIIFLVPFGVIVFFLIGRKQKLQNKIKEKEG